MEVHNYCVSCKLSYIVLSVIEVCDNFSQFVPCSHVVRGDVGLWTPPLVVYNSLVGLLKQSRLFDV